MGTINFFFSFVVDWPNLLFSIPSLINTNIWYYWGRGEGCCVAKKNHVVITLEVVLIFQINLARLRTVMINSSEPWQDMNLHLFRLLLCPLTKISNSSIKVLHIFARLTRGSFFFGWAISCIWSSGPLLQPLL